ncbi:hypothetical protein A9G42_01030 [Gilliamella sp. Nev6-6]|uniref:RCC1 domain-containing protein n=1 Tax=Gilliamella sp. Nev6-6 TaxID=3120252 RepID=UPI00080F529B|nr:hypothetical protein [Gilliamella apicola]OCG77235.1 hypothetical protein A9G42_01030 [Gilliamella apicola]
MRITKIIILFMTCICFPLLAEQSGDKRTDALIFLNASEADPIARTSLRKTGLTIENGDLWIWGYRYTGQQGNGVTRVRRDRMPARVNTFVRAGLSITQVAAGKYHIIALDDRGDVWGWGRNLRQEATGGQQKRNGKKDDRYVNEPVSVLKEQDVIEIACGRYNSYALTRSGDVYSWGSNLRGQSGTGTRSSAIALTKITGFGGKKIVKIGSGYDSGYAISEDGEVFAWGDGDRGAFGEELVGKNRFQTKPKAITQNLKAGITDFSSGKKILYIGGGSAYTMILLDNGRVYGMGKSSRLGIQGPYEEDEELPEDNDDGDSDDLDENNDEIEDDRDDYHKELTPEEIDEENEKREDQGSTHPTPTLVTTNVRSLFCRFRGCVAITNDNKLVTWGHKRGIYKNILYGANPTIRDNIHGPLTKIDVGHQHFFYWNEEGQAFGVGYGSSRKISPNNNKRQDWPGLEMKFLTDEMKRVYGDNYILGQVQ